MLRSILSSELDVTAVLLGWLDGKVQCVGTFCVLLLLDISVLSVYIKKGLSPTMTKYYGKKILFHTVACLLLLGIAILAHIVSIPADVNSEWHWAMLLRVCEGCIGLCVVVAGGSSLALARHTSGYEGFNWAGYTMYTLLWIYTGLALFTDPATREKEKYEGSGHSVYECWVISHAFLFCRIFTMALKPLNDVLGGPKMVYAVGTSIATLVPLAIAYDWHGFQCWAVSIVVCIAVEVSGAGDWIHVRGKKSQIRSNPLNEGEYASGKHYVK
eukprot:TRINITY_DN11137_c0_g1_i1.p1 TRINITY_DN11137_c0_g1~~TRINITY_DN11137_c0_g1_i1.p1  ORF type:complete len:271 (-),score=65.32 TRINITY_DN11137_c0_g1_i1:236-1048(-)